MSECRDCRAGLKQALSMDIGWRCLTHGVQRLDQQAIIRSHPLFTLAQDIINSALADVEPTDDPADCCGMDAGDAHEHGAQAEHRRIADLLATTLAPWEGTGVVPVEGEAHG